jgi:oligopeptide/dipeptide ABC transporter ATP-binding protein
MKSIPQIDGDRNERLYMIPGTVPLLSQVPSGCRFAGRCMYAEDRCRVEFQELRVAGSIGNHKTRCWKTAGGLT